MNSGHRIKGVEFSGLWVRVGGGLGGESQRNWDESEK